MKENEWKTYIYFDPKTWRLFEKMWWGPGAPKFLSSQDPEAWPLSYEEPNEARILPLIGVL